MAFGGCAELLGIEPDLVTWGKIIGGGFPVGAVAGRRELLGQLAPDGAVYQAGTLSANPVAMAAGRATLDALLDGRVHARLEALGEQLANAASALRGLRLQRAGSMFWLAAGDGEIIRTPAAIPGGQADFYRRLFQAALQAGIYLPPSPVETAFLSAAHQPSHVDALAQVIASAC